MLALKKQAHVSDYVSDRVYDGVRVKTDCEAARHRMRLLRALRRMEPDTALPERLRSRVAETDPV